MKYCETESKSYVIMKDQLLYRVHSCHHGILFIIIEAAYEMYKFERSLLITISLISRSRITQFI